jgi:hypothetical protein
MDQPQKRTESIQEVIHRKKVPKKEQQATSQLAVGQQATGNRTAGSRVAQRVNESTPLLPEVELATDNQRLAADQLEQPATGRARTRAQLVNDEIDTYLYGLVAEGLVNLAFNGWYAKVIHALGIQRVNMIVINVRQTQKCTNPQKLLSYKLKGALNQHYKLMYEADHLDSEQR